MRVTAVLAEAPKCRKVRSGAISKRSGLPLPLLVIRIFPFSTKIMLTALEIKFPIRWTALPLRRCIGGYFVVEQAKTGLEILPVAVGNEPRVRT